MSKKSLSVQVRHLENSRDNWKRLAQEILSKMVDPKINPSIQNTTIQFGTTITNWQSRCRYLNKGDEEDAQK